MEYFNQTVSSLFDMSGPVLAVPFDMWLKWFGHFHYIFVHFPIALITMAVIAELLYSRKKDPRYHFLIDFLLVAAAIFVIPTVFSGLSLEAAGAVSEESNPLIEWHEVFGFLTFSLALITLGVRLYLRNRLLYLLCLAFLFISMCTAAYLGGLIAFGDNDLLPPIAIAS